MNMLKKVSAASIGLVALMATTPLAAQTATAVAAGPASVPAVDPDARAALDRMGTALRKLSGFSAHADVTTETVLVSGQKIQGGGTLDFSVRRPGALKIAIATDSQSRDIYYDGKSVTIFSPDTRMYGSFAAPASIGLTLDLAKTKYGIEIPLADLFMFGVDQTMTARIKSGFAVGTETINGNVCEHYAFRQAKVDWQLWIRRDESALPCKLVITTTDDPSMPQYTALLSWVTNVVQAPEVFVFTPPADAIKIRVATTDTPDK